MSPRFYWITLIVALALTTLISWFRQTRTGKEYFLTLAGVSGGLVLLGLLLWGFATLLVYLGIAKSGFDF